MEHLAKCLEMKYTEFLNGLGGQLMESALTWTKLLLKHLEGSNCKKRPVLGHGPEIYSII